jgi:hypothetical protein
MVSDDALLDEISRLADGKSPPTAREFNEKAKYSTTPVRNRWESWNAALQEAGYPPNKNHGISDKDLLNEINRLADSKSPPTATEFANRADYDVSTVSRRWGSWNSALREAGHSPNKKHDVSDRELLNALREDAHGQIAPEWEDTTNCEPETYTTRFGNWWRACTQAGLQPHKRRPLTHTESQQFFEAATEQQKPRDQLVGLLSQFTGPPLNLLSKISPDWITTPAKSLVITIPANETRSGEKWTFKIPNTWNDATGERRETNITGLLTWLLEHENPILFTRRRMDRIIYQIAQDAGLPNREKVHRDQVGRVPLVRHDDLRATGGIQMARNGAPARRIRRHLGIEHTDWNADVEDFFLWLYVHEGYEHPEYDPPDVVLDSVL